MTSHTMHTSVTLDVLMQDSGVTFGTSGARGRVMDMTDRVCYAYVTAFTVYARGLGEAPPGGRVALAGDLRPSTPRILAACSQALVDQGLMPVNLGTIPTPALALYALEHRLPGLMVTGSHIPDDRNGIKFYRPQGEILKADEIALRGVTIWLDPARFDAAGQWWSPPRVPDPIPDGHGAFVARYLDSFSPHCLRGLRVAVYEHSSVARESLAEVLAGLGAEVVCLGRSGQFVPVDTEAIRPEDQVLARAWAKQVGFDAIVSADGDGDRPLLGDERGEWWRGDLIGPWCARFLGIRTLVTPVSSNTLVEKSGWFEQVIRTRIGSPYVITAMAQAVREGRGPVAGYEANGGFLTASPLSLARGTLVALPTRDCLLPILAVLCDARASGRPLSALTQGLPQRFTHSGRLQDFPATISQARLAAWCPTDLSVVSQMAACERLEDFFGAVLGAVHTLDLTDGLRITFASGDILHLRPSGNAPELRVYVEASSPGAAEAMTASSLALLEGWRRA